MSIIPPSSPPEPAPDPGPRGAASLLLLPYTLLAASLFLVLALLALLALLLVPTLNGRRWVTRAA